MCDFGITNSKIHKPAFAKKVPDALLRSTAKVPLNPPPLSIVLTSTVTHAF